jgi:hypothetical protein
MHILMLNHNLLVVHMEVLNLNHNLLVEQPNLEDMVIIIWVVV